MTPRAARVDVPEDRCSTSASAICERELFLCTGNSARSQIAEALVEHRSSGTVHARSAGSRPKPLHPNTVHVMAERGIDISGRPTKSLNRFTHTRFDRVITLCDKVREICPEFPGAPIAAHWSIADPASAGDTTRRRIRRSNWSPRRSTTAWRCCWPTSESDNWKGPTMADEDIVSVRYLVDDVVACVDFYTRHFGFTVGISTPIFSDVIRGNLRLLLSGPQSSAGQAMTDGERPGPGGWNRIHLIVDDLDREIARLTDEGVGSATRS